MPPEAPSRQGDRGRGFVRRLVVGDERRAWVGFAAVVIVTIAIGWLVFGSIAHIDRDKQAINRVYETLAALDATLSSLQDVETGQRGYLLTANADFLAPFSAGVERAGADLALLRTLIAGDPVQLERLASLEALAAEKIGFAREAMAIRDAQGASAADQFVVSGRGKAVMDEVRSVVASMNQTETDRLQAHSTSWDADTRDPLILTVVAAVLSLALFAVLLRAVTRSLAGQRRAAETAARLAAIVGASADGIVSLDRDGHVTSWNAGAEQIFGYSAAEALGRPISFLAPPDQAEGQRAVLRTVREGASLAGEELVRLAEDGHRVDVSLTAFPLTDAAGNLSGTAGIYRDITAAKRASQALRDWERRFVSVFDLSPVGIAITRVADGVVIDANPRLLGMLGFAPEDFVGHSTLNLNIWVDSSLRAGLIQQISEGGPVEDMELSWRTSSGGVIEAITAWQRLELGGETCLLSLLLDITERKRVERQVDRLFQITRDFLCIAGLDGYFKRINPTFERLLGYTEDELLAKPFFDFIHPDDVAATEAEVANLATGALTVAFTNRYRCKDGTYRWLSWNSVPVPEEGLIYTIARDVTAWKEMEDALRAAQAEAVQANLAKTTFLSRMSHELRTPLNVVLGFGQVLQLDELNSDQSDAVDQILKAGRHLLSLIDEVLDIARIEAGRLALSVEPVRADELVADVLMLMRPLAGQRLISVNADLDPGAVYVLADLQRTKQILLNLISNAIKYNREGGAVLVTSEQRASALRLTVADTGPGIPAEKFGRLFSPFDRLDAEAGGVEGTGLGLALSKHLTEAMGGAIGVESTVGMGSRFWFELPLGGPLAEGLAGDATGAGRTQDAFFVDEEGGGQTGDTVVVGDRT